MKTLPDNVVPYKRTPEFTEANIPKGLLKDHRTKEGVWGKVVVLEGSLKYTIVEPELETVTLNTRQHGVIEPEILHHISLCGPVRLYIEFNR